MTPTLVYTPSRTLLWLRVLVRELLIPERRWGRMLVGPFFLAFGALGIVLGPALGSSALALVSGSLCGIGLGWASWPLAGAWLAVMRNPRVRKRQPIRLTLTTGVIDLVRGDDRRVFPLDDLERMDRVGGEWWLRFRGGRFVILPRSVSEGDPKLFLALIRAHQREAPAAASAPAAPRGAGRAA
jgi:hypothetical protein